MKELLQTLGNCLSYANTKWAMFPELVKVLSYGMRRTITQDKGE
jgi:hypothetical protein